MEKFVIPIFLVLEFTLIFVSPFIFLYVLEGISEAIRIYRFERKKKNMGRIEEIEECIRLGIETSAGRSINTR